MKRLAGNIAVCAVLAVLCAAAWAARVGAPAPEFTATDSNAKVHKLADYKGKVVVLEWHNQGCPYVKKHYDSGNMQRLQKEWTARGVVWLVVISSAPGKQGYVTPAQANEYLVKMNSAPTAVLLDPEGTLGRLYDAKTSPHMYVIDAKGVLVYNGAIDSKPTSDAADIPSSTNYVRQALEEVMAGKPVSVPTSTPYGCSVKYAQ